MIDGKWWRVATVGYYEGKIAMFWLCFRCKDTPKPLRIKKFFAPGMVLNQCMVPKPNLFNCKKQIIN
jgi:hypothetical protein